MNLKTIHLLMMKCTSAQDGRRREQLLARRTQARVRRERPVFCQPGTDRALGDVPVKTCVQSSLGFGERVAEVERRDSLEDEPERVHLVFRWGTGKTVQAFGALENLMDLQTVAALAFLDGVFAAALRAHGVLLCGDG